MFRAAKWSGIEWFETSFPDCYTIIFIHNTITILIKIISIALISAPFNINTSPISFELKYAAIWSGVFSMPSPKESILLLVLALISAPFDINISPISFELFSAA